MRYKIKILKLQQTAHIGEHTFTHIFENIIGGMEK
jgi:hypothetical protein